MSYRMDKKVDGQTHTYTDAGDENSRRPILASGKKLMKKKELGLLHSSGTNAVVKLNNERPRVEGRWVKHSYEDLGLNT